MATSSERMIADLDSPDETTRRFAVEDLGDCGDQAAVELLARALEDPSPAVCEAALDALERIGGAEVVEAVLPALRSEHVPLRNSACLLLSQLGDLAVESLAEMAANEPKDVRLFAIDTLAKIGSPSAETALVWALGDDDVNVAAAAAIALGEIGSASAVAPLVAALKADSWVRCAAAKSLGRIGSQKALQPLMRLVNDEDPLVAFAASQALIEAGKIRNTPSKSGGEEKSS